MAGRPPGRHRAPLRWARLALSALLFSGVASAQDASTGDASLPIDLDLSECPDLDVALVRRLLRIELTLSLEERESRPEDVTQVAASCADSEATIRVDDPTTGKTTSRRVRLAHASERLLALAAAELISASWAEHHVRPRPEVEHLDQTASEEVTEEATEVVARRVFTPLPPREPEEVPPAWTFGALFGSIGVSGRPAHATFGLGLQVGLELNRLFAALFDVTYDLGRVDTQIGRVELRRITAGLGLVIRQRIGMWVPYGGIGGRAGYAFLRGDPDSTSSQAVTGRVGGPYLVGGVSVGEGAIMGVAWLEVGWHTWSQRGYLGSGPDAPLLAAKDRGWATLQVAVAVRLGGSSSP